MRSRVRVLPTLSKRGLFATCFALGFAHGLIGAWSIWATSDWLFGWGGPTTAFGAFRIFAIVAAGFLFPGVMAGMLIRRVHPVKWRMIACGALYGAACLPGIVGVILAANPGAMLGPWEPGLVGGWQFLIQVLVLLGFGAVVLPTLFIVALGAGGLIERWIGKRIIPQTGRVCWGCGYDLGSEIIGVCPECAEPFDAVAKPRADSPRVLGALVRVRWAILAACVLAALAPVLYQLNAHTIPSIHFLRACPSDASLQQTNMLGNAAWRPGNRGARMPISYGWWIPDSGSPTTGTAVQFLPSDENDRPAMFVTRACLMDLQVPAGAVIVGPVPKQEIVEPGTIRVRARLTAEQTASVIAERAVPAGLLDAIRRDAEAGSWKPVDAMVTPATTARNDVDASPFFH